MDIDGDNAVELSEWIAMSINKKDLITQEKLEIAFNFFDSDGSGTIDANEVKARLIGDNTNLDDKLWESMIDEVDQNGDREIDFMEFCFMMRKIVEDWF